MESKLLYHITDYRNLPSILVKGHLATHSFVSSKQMPYSDIAHQSIQYRRITKKVDVYPYGVLHDYVPFYFAPRSPMLYALSNGRVEGFQGTQDDIIYLVTSIDNIVNREKEFVFTDGHAIMFITEFYNDLNDLKELDWDVLKSRYWNDTNEDPDRKRRRQAEFLVYHSAELDLFLGIGVRNNDMKHKVNEILKEYNVDMQVLTRPSFYY
ncbi:type II toxin-antitoxin system toxin DNA ADP-ribosyl transferase DarT [Oceanobacillus timonensis]|uniref:type II toxin-antitoxin system toxin DNA ADP-ribosyl transferase DarT n=1 Tax=Oceanobacillus timonensis TaxID=1926285 RepID=UPI0009BB9EFA|nr:DUF4433 domain-containing protein [Oceanobacillus timonensis]